MSEGYEAIAWARRPSGGNMFLATRRHQRVPDLARTVCGVVIPDQVLNPRERRQFAGTVTTLTAREIAELPACGRCDAAIGGTA